MSALVWRPTSIDHQTSTRVRVNDNTKSEETKIAWTQPSSVVRFLFEPCVRNQKPLNGTNRHPRLHALEASRRSVPLSRRVFCHPCGVPVRPCGGHNNNQALCGHHNLLAGNHRTLQAFFLRPPSWGAETWADDDRHIQHGEEVILIVHGGRVCLPYSDHPCNGHHEEVARRGGHPDGSCQGQHASTLSQLSAVTVGAEYAYRIINGYTDRPAAELLAVQFLDSTISILTGKILKYPSEYERQSFGHGVCAHEAHPWPGKSRSISANETLPASRPKSFKS